MDQSPLPAPPPDVTTMAGPPRQAGDPLAPGDVVGRYDVRCRVGAGAMGVVYRAVDRQLGRPVALKMLPAPAPGTSACSIMCSLLLNEARVMARLSHPNLVTVYEVGEHAGCVYLAMEYIDGTTLRAWAAAPERSWRDRLGALLEAGDGLVEAHRAGVVHRDFKPDNVLVNSRGRALVGDFGLARTVSDWQHVLSTVPSCCGGGPKTADALIAATARVGTPGYMAPEQESGEPADEKSDQFAFGVSAWELAFGALPFPAGPPQARLAAVATGPAPVAHSERGAEMLAEIIGPALAETPAARYPTLADLVARLRDAARA